MTVEVVLPLPLDEAFTYRVPPDVRAGVVPGVRVVVPFRRRTLTGVVVRLGPPADAHTGDYALKDVADVLDETPALSAAMLRLTRWMADYYVCPWGEAIKAALPTGTGVKTTHRLARTDAPPGAWAAHDVGRRVLADLDRRANGTTLGALRKRLAPPVPLALVRRMAADGVLRLDTDLRDPRVTVKTAAHLRFAPPFRHAGAAAELKEQLRGIKQRAVIDALAALAAEGEDEPPQRAVMDRADASYSTVGSLVEKGMVEQVEREVMRSPLDDLPDPGAPPAIDLHPGQQHALDALTRALDAERYATFLLHGVTGSGKTEVYIRALKRAVAQGRTGIILVPEIALTPQTVQRFRAPFGDRIAVLHSQMSAGERFDAWRALRDGRRSIAIGPRSAILAPLERLGLIVVDEEHEGSYKQFDPAPRYHARDVAVMRAHQAGAVCVLGSATPSLESVMNARWGKYTRLPMPERVPKADGTTATLPTVQIVDLTLEHKKHRLEGALSADLRAAIAARLRRREQVILLQNRRGYAPVIECEDCGWSPRCGACSVTLTYHKPRHRLRCHYCGWTTALPRACPTCASGDLTQLGTGTQRVEEELADLFPDATVLRMDRDTTGRKHAHHRILRRFEHEGDVLLGTQMVAKGLDFGRVTLVGVVNADTGLLLPDFRAEERTVQLLMQVAGRAGRAERSGEVLLQTRNPAHPALLSVRAHDFGGFVEGALAERKLLGYPPFGRLASVEVRGPKRARAERLAETWAHALRQHAGASTEVLGPEPAFIARVKRQYRFRTILKSRQAQGALQQTLRRTHAALGTPPRGYHVSLDVDAMGLF